MTEVDDAQNATPPAQKFVVVGIITSEDFQKCRYAVQKLHKSFPKEFDAPDVRPMLDVEWNEFILKYQRRLGNGLWAIKNKVVVFKDGEFLGDFDGLFEFIWKKRRFTFNENWKDLAYAHLVEYLEEKIAKYRQLVYLTIAINNQVIGSLLFELYNDLVPLTCENFLRRCQDKENGYAGAPIHRIVKSSWIQGGGYNIEPRKIPCENYVVPHERRGILSMCNNGHHRDNSTQFFVTLEDTPWMNYRYVAFGQLIQGDDVLKTISDVSTYYQAPTRDIVIVKCGEFKTRFQADSSDALFPSSINMDQWKDEVQQQMDILTYLKKYHEVVGTEDQCAHQDWKEPEVMRSCDTMFSMNKLKQGAYSLQSDLRSYEPFTHLPDFGDDGDEGDEDTNICEPTYPLIRYYNKLYDDDISPDPSDITL